MLAHVNGFTAFAEQKNPRIEVLPLHDTSPGIGSKAVGTRAGNRHERCR